MAIALVHIDDPTTEPATAIHLAATQPALRVVFSGADVFWHEHIVERSRTEIGRGVPEGANLRIDNDGRMSRLHAVILLEKGAVKVEDKSAHGTYLNGERVEGTMSVKDGDVLRLGDTFIVVRHVPENPRDASSPTLLGRAPSMQGLRSLIGVVGPTRASVLLLGETGAGKEVAARAIHERSERKGPFVAVNCAAIPENLAESQLFGHRAGSFTGAQKDHVGFFREAHNGTLFLDEVGELPLSLQPKLLRVLDERQVFAVGASTGVPVDVRLVAATNRQIAHEVETGAFRGDLFARLAEITINLPTLRNRVEDVLLLLSSALPAVASGEMKLSPALVSSLLLHSWPFNVRELMKIATELEVKAQGRTLLDVDLLAGRVLGPRANKNAEVTGPVPVQSVAPKVDTPAPTKEQLEALLAAHKGKVSDIARATGRSRTQVYRWLEEFGLTLDAYRR